MKPFTQGNLDGMCGIYSVVNALHSIRPLQDKKAEWLFKIIIKKFPKIFPRAFYEGTLFKELHLINDFVAKKLFSQRYKCYLPIRKKKTITEWVDILEKRLADGKTAIIVGLGEPEHHWTVCVAVERKRNGRYLKLFDSHWGFKSFRESKFSTFKKRNKIQVHTMETIILSK